MKKIVLLLLGILIFGGFIIAGLKLLTGEDDWICSNGEWIKHGNPASPKPAGRCP